MDTKLLEQRNFDVEDIKKIISVLSDVQEEINFGHPQMARGHINLVKMFLMGKVVIKEDDNFCWQFVRKDGQQGRFCTTCGLLNEGEYKECTCEQNTP